MWFALVPWASVLDKGGLAATIVGSTFAGTLVGLMGYEFVLIHPYPGALIKAVWIGGSIFFAGLSWMAGTLVARWMIRRGRPRLLLMLFLVGSIRIYRGRLEKSESCNEETGSTMAGANLR